MHQLTFEWRAQLLLARVLPVHRRPRVNHLRRLDRCSRVLAHLAVQRSVRVHDRRRLVRLMPQVSTAAVTWRARLSQLTINQ